MGYYNPYNTLPNEFYMPKSTGGRRPTAGDHLEYYRTTAPDHLSHPYTSIWRGSLNQFPLSNPKPYSYQIYVLSNNTSFSPTTTTGTNHFAEAETLLAKLVEGKGGYYEYWRLDIHAMPEGFSTEDCARHYLALKDFRGGRGGEGLHTVSSYCGDAGTHFENVFFVVDGGRWRELPEGKGEGGTGLRCVEFGKVGNYWNDEDEKADDVEEEDEEEEDEEEEIRLCGMKAKVFRLGVMSVGQRMQCELWGCATVRQDYEDMWAEPE